MLYKIFGPDKKVHMCCIFRPAFGCCAPERAGIDLAKRQFRRDFYLTEDSLWRLDDLLKGLGIEPGKSYEEALPEAVGKAVQVQIQRIIGQQDGAVMNTVGLLTPAE